MADAHHLQPPGYILENLFIPCRASQVLLNGPFAPDSKKGLHFLCRPSNVTCRSLIFLLLMKCLQCLAVAVGLFKHAAGSSSLDVVAESPLNHDKVQLTCLQAVGHTFGQLHLVRSKTSAQHSLTRRSKKVWWKEPTGDTKHRKSREAVTSKTSKLKKWSLNYVVAHVVKSTLE